MAGKVDLLKSESKTLQKGSAELCQFPLVSPVFFFCFLFFASLFVVCLSPSVCQCFVSVWEWLTYILVVSQTPLTCCSTHLKSIYTVHQLPVLRRPFPSSLRQFVVKQQSRPRCGNT